MKSSTSSLCPAREECYGCERQLGWRTTRVPSRVGVDDDDEESDDESGDEDAEKERNGAANAFFVLQFYGAIPTLS